MKTTEFQICEDEARHRGDVTAAQVAHEKGLLPFVLVRTYGAGVHMGYLIRLHGQTAELLHSRRLWRWRGANTLDEVATKGVSTKEYTRISEAALDKRLTTVIEVIGVTEKAKASLDVSVWSD